MEKVTAHPHEDAIARDLAFAGGLKMTIGVKAIGREEQSIAIFQKSACMGRICMRRIKIVGCFYSYISTIRCHRCAILRRPIATSTKYGVPSYPCAP